MALCAAFDVELDEVIADQNGCVRLGIPQEFLKVLDYILILFVLLGGSPFLTRSDGSHFFQNVFDDPTFSHSAPTFPLAEQFLVSSSTELSRSDFGSLAARAESGTWNVALIEMFGSSMYFSASRRVHATRGGTFDQNSADLRSGPRTTPWCSDAARVETIRDHPCRGRLPGL